MQHRKIIVSTTICVIGLATPFCAQAEGRFTVALGASLASGFYEGADSEIGLFPYVSYENGPIRIGLDGAYFRLDATDALQLSFGLTPRGAPDYPDTPLFEGLDRDTAYEALVSASYAISSDTRLALSVQRDLFGEHSGTEVSAAFGVVENMGPVHLDAQAGLRHRSADLNDFLVGVRSDEANAQRAAYAPGATTSPFAGVTATLPLSAQSAVIGSLSYDYFGNAYRDSPLVDSRSSTSVSMGFAYSF